MIHILWFDQGLKIVLQNLGEIILELRSTEVLENFLPVWGILGAGNYTSVCRYSPKIHVTYVISSKIGFKFSGQNLQRRTLSDTVCSHETEHLTRPWSREPMQFEGVGGVAMRDLRFQVGRQVDDCNSLKRTPATRINEGKVKKADKFTS